jgi:hypothetical protein
MSVSSIGLPQALAPAISRVADSPGIRDFERLCRSLMADEPQAAPSPTTASPAESAGSHGNSAPVNDLAIALTVFAMLDGRSAGAAPVSGETVVAGTTDASAGVIRCDEGVLYQDLVEGDTASVGSAVEKLRQDLQASGKLDQILNDVASRVDLVRLDELISAAMARIG